MTAAILDISHSIRGWAVISAAALLAACGGDDSSPSFSVGGSVTGLLPGTSVVLQNNGSNNTPVTVNASFSFSTALASGSRYAVTVLTQPVGERCSVANSSGVVASASVSVAVTCTPNSYSIGGSVTGLLTGNSVVLVDNGGNSTTISANGAFTFSTSLASGSTYAVAVAVQPTGQTCSATNATGTLAGSNVTNVTIDCSTESYTVSADIFGLLPNTSVVLQNNAGDTLTASSSGTLNFSTPLPSDSAYAVTVLTQPAGETCIVINGTGNIAGANVTVSVVCPWHVAYVANESADAVNGTISAYYIDPVTGALQAVVGSPFAAGAYPTIMAVTPNGKFALVTNQADAGSVSVFAVAPTTGALAPVAGSPFGAGADPLSLAIDPTGQFVYVGERGDQSSGGTTPDGISAYTLNGTTGALAPIAGSQYSAIPGPVPLVLDPNGSFLFTWANTYSPATYTVNTMSGGLTPIAGSTGFATNVDTAGGVAINAAGTFLYSVAGGVYGYAIDSSTGALTSITGSPFGSAAGGALAIAPGGQYAYVADPAGDVWAYSIDQTSGALTPMAGSPYPVPANVSAIAIDPSGKFLYVSRWNGGGTWAFAVNSTSGALTPVTGSPFAGLGGFSIAITSLP